MLITVILIIFNLFQIFPLIFGHFISTGSFTKQRGLKFLRKSQTLNVLPRSVLVQMTHIDYRAALQNEKMNHWRVWIHHSEKLFGTRQPIHLLCGCRSNEIRIFTIMYIRPKCLIEVWF